MPDFWDIFKFWEYGPIGQRDEEKKRRRSRPSFLQQFPTEVAPEPERGFKPFLFPFEIAQEAGGMIGREFQRRRGAEVETPPLPPGISRGEEATRQLGRFLGGMAFPPPMTPEEAKGPLETAFFATPPGAMTVAPFLAAGRAAATVGAFKTGRAVGRGAERAAPVVRRALAEEAGFAKLPEGPLRPGVPEQAAFTMEGRLTSEIRPGAEAARESQVSLLEWGKQQKKLAALKEQVRLPQAPETPAALLKQDLRLAFDEPIAELSKRLKLARAAKVSGVEIERIQSELAGMKNLRSEALWRGMPEEQVEVLAALGERGSDLEMQVKAISEMLRNEPAVRYLGAVNPQGVLISDAAFIKKYKFGYDKIAQELGYERLPQRKAVSGAYLVPDEAFKDDLLRLWQARHQRGRLLLESKDIAAEEAKILSQYDPKVEAQIAQRAVKALERESKLAQVPPPAAPPEAVAPGVAKPPQAAARPMHPTLGRPMTDEEIALSERLRQTQQRFPPAKPSPVPPRKRMTPGEAAEAAALERELGFRAPTAPPEAVAPGVAKAPQAAAEYRISHRPSSEGPRGHNLLETDMAPSDIYDRPELYTGDPRSKGFIESVRGLRQIRGKPDVDVTVYRASPIKELNSGDWVSLSKDYALREGMADVATQDVSVHAFTVKAKDIRWAGDTLEEFGYFPEAAQPPQAAAAVVTTPPATVKSLSEVQTGKPFVMRLYRGESGVVNKAIEIKQRTGLFMTPDANVASDYALSGEGVLGARVVFGEERFTNPVIFENFMEAAKTFFTDMKPPYDIQGSFDELMAGRARSLGYDSIVYTKGEFGSGVVVDLRPGRVPPPVARPAVRPPTVAPAPPGERPPVKVPPTEQPITAAPEVEAPIITTPPPPTGTIGKVMGMWQEPPKPPHISFREKVADFRRTVEEQVSDKFAGINKMTARARKQIGKDLPEELDAELQAALVAGMPEAALQRSHDAFRYMRQTLGKGIDEDFVNTFLHLRHNIDVVTQKGPQRLIAGGVKGIPEAEAGLNEMANILGPAKMARVEKAAGVIRDIYGGYLSRFVDEGLVSGELANLLRQKYPWYNPIRYMEKLAQVAEGTGGKALSVTRNDIRRLSELGSEAARERPLTGLPRYILRSELLIQRNKAAKAIIRVAEQDIQIADRVNRVKGVRPVAQVEGKAIFRRPPGEIRGTISIMEDGKRVIYEVPGWLEQEAKFLGFVSSNTLERVANSINAVSRAGFTGYNPAFFVPNLAVDTLTAYLGSGAGPVSLGRGLARNLKNIFVEDKVVAEMRRFGAGQSGFWGRTPEAIVREVEKSGQLAIRSKKDWKNILGMPLRAIGKLGHAIEMSPRTAIFEKAIAKGVSPQRAALQARRGTIDFQRSGIAVRQANNLFLYLNAGFQGALLPGRVLIANPASRYRVAGLVAAAGALYMWNRQFPEYEDVPDYIKFGTMPIMLPSEEYNREGNKIPHYITTIPNLREWAAFTGVATYALHRLDTSNPTDFGQFFASWSPGIMPFGQITGAGGIPVPTVAGETLTELALNRDIFRGREIIPPALKALPKEQQYQRYTPETLKRIAKVFGLSPLQVEFFVNNVFGGVGRMVVGIPEAFLGKEKPSAYISHLVEQLDAIKPPAVPMDAVQLRRQELLGSLDKDTRQAVLKVVGEGEKPIPVVDAIVRRFYRTYGGQVADNEARAAKQRIQKEATQKGLTAEEAYYKSSRWKYFDQQTVRDEWLAAGQKPDGTPYGNNDWLEDYERAMVELATRSDIRQELLGPFRERKPRTDFERAIQGYYDIIDKFPEDEGGTRDIPALAEALDLYLDGFPEEEQGRLIERIGMWDTPTVRQWRVAKRQLKPYWKLRDTILEQLTFPDGKKATEVEAQIIRYRNKAAVAASPQERGKYEALVHQVYKQYPAMKTVVEPRIEYEKKLMRHRDAVIDRLLVKWGKTSTYLHPFNREAQREGRLSMVPR